MGNRSIELLVVFDSDFLHRLQIVPSFYDDVVEVFPFSLVVEFARGDVGYAPDVVEGFQDLHAGILFEIEDFVCGSCVEELVEEVGNFLIAPWETDEFVG